MVQCPECGEEIDEDDTQWDCPFCGYEDCGEGYYECENCGTLFDWQGEIWECENCGNEGITPDESHHDDFEDEDYCEDGIPHVNQGWVGEHYG